LGAIGVFLLYTFASEMPGLIPPSLSAFTFTLLLLAVAVLHGTIGYRARDLAAFFVITFIVRGCYGLGPMTEIAR
jgi:hypothetical protein